jgi:exodeoxyribonuclease-3
MAIRVISLNCNGIRAAARKGFFEWLERQNADFVCLQETKAQERQLEHQQFRPDGYHVFYEDAEKKGYSGVAVFSRQQPARVIRGFGSAEFDPEGRYLEVQVDGLSVVSVYLPSGSSSDVRQQAKFRFLAEFEDTLRRIRRRKREYLLCGDWNIAHKPIDLRNWKQNQKNSGFLPEERAWMDRLLSSGGYVDTFRRLNTGPYQYTWWSNRGRAWDNNVGWRIDYQIATPGLADSTIAAEIYKDQRFSDHAPLTIDYGFAGR